MKKPYKSLQDVYVESRQTPVEENVQIIGIPDASGESEQLGSVTDDEYTRLKRMVLSKSEGGTESMVKKILRESMWETIPEIDDRVLDIFLRYDVDPVILGKIADKKTAGTLGTFETWVNKSGEQSLEACLDPLIRKLTPEWRQLFKDVTEEVTPKPNNVSVGPGEISITMFTNAKKGNTGDLTIGEQEIEVKGQGGRLGSSDYTKQIFNTPGNKYLNMLNARGSGQHFSQVESVEIKNLLSKYATDVKKNWTNILTKLVKAGENAFPGSAVDVEGLINQLIQSADALIDVKNTYDIQQTIDNLQSSLDQVVEQIPVSKAARDNTQKTIKKLNDLLTVGPDKTSYNWQSSTQYMFNHDWGMSPRELAEAFVEMRTDVMDDVRVKSLTNAAESVFKNNNLRKDLITKGPTGTTTLRRLQAALMATSYWNEHEFNKILVINPAKMTGANINFDSNMIIGDIFLDVYKQLQKMPQIVVTNPGVDDRNKGIGISLL